MSNPFTAPDGQPHSTDPGQADEVLALVVGMRFPMLLVGGLYVLSSLALIGLGGVMFLGTLGGGVAAREQPFLLGIAAMYTVFGGITILPSGLLVRAGLAALLARGDPEQVLTSLRAQLWFWRVLAIYIFGFTGLYVLLFFGMVAASIYL